MSRAAKVQTCDFEHGRNRLSPHLNALEILSAGFRDGAPYLPEWFDARRGVWVSLNFPLTPDEGAHGDDVIVMSIPTALFEKYEVREERKPYREAMIPASELNKYLANVRLLSRHEQDELAEAELGPPRELTKEDWQRIQSMTREATDEDW
jgi:hypothetical protein